ncbi:hypothetical protein I4U23_027387 [Adineta vaga]|nr:hypothetical protein I4U23_027387 [Adineta vaga]
MTRDTKICPCECVLMFCFLITVVCTNFTTQITYSTGSGSKPFPITTGDLKGNGKPDIVVGLSGSDEIGILFNTGNVAVRVSETHISEVLSPTAMYTLSEIKRQI